MFLVSRSDLLVERDTLPLHVVSKEPPETELAVARHLLEHRTLWARYKAWLAALHVSTWQEVKVMARTKGEEFTIDLRPLIKDMGIREVIRQMGKKRVIEELGSKEILKEMGIHRFVMELSPAERREMKRLLDESA